ncbi:hypothetical protein HDU78_006461, partial [Chytriomyces hyalinus]
MTQLPTTTELYSIAMANNGCSCARYLICGAELVPGDMVKFTSVTVDGPEDQLEDAVAA